MEANARRFAPAFLMSVALAGTCLAAPGIALADAAAGAEEQPAVELEQQAGAGLEAEGSNAAAEEGASSETPASADEAEAQGAQAAADGTYACGGVQITVPEDFEVADLEYMLIATNADASIVISVSPSGSDDTVPADPAEWGAFFEPFAESSATEMGGTYEDGGIYTLADGTQAQVFAIGATETDGTPIVLAQCYVPLADGTFTLVQVGCYADDEATVELADSISETIVLASDEAEAEAGQAADTADVAAADDAAATDVQTVQAGGIELDLPAGYVADESSTETEPSWLSADGNVMIGVTPNLLDEYSTVGEEGLDLLALIVAEGLGGELAGSTVLPNGVYAYTLTFSVEGQEGIAILGMVPLADDTVKSILAMTPLENAANSDAEDTAVFESVRVL